MQRELVGSFELGNKVDITDPCYDKGTWCRMTVDCKPGTYYGYVDIDNYGDGEDDYRVSRISIYKDDNQIDDDDMELIGNIGVDAGLAGFFNDKPDFPEDDEWMGFLKKADVFKQDGEYNYSRCHYDVEYGLFSESGFGDGGYDVYANEERSAFQIVFINEEDDNYES